MKQDFDKLFTTLEPRLYKFLKNHFDRIVASAPDKDYAKLQNYKDHYLVPTILFKGNPFNVDLINEFIHSRKMGYPPSWIVSKLDDLHERHIALEGFSWELIVDESQEEEKPDESETLPTKSNHQLAYTWNSELFEDPAPRKVIRFLIRYWAHEKISQYLYSQISHLSEEEKQKIRKRTLPPFSNEAQDTPPSEEKGSKQKVIRKKDDQLTTLSLEQTATLAYLIRQLNLVLPTEHLPNTLLAEAFHLMTGYSKNTLRVNIGNARPSKATLKMIKAELIRALEQVDSEIDSAK